MTGMALRRTYAACRKSWGDRTSRRMWDQIASTGDPRSESYPARREWRQRLSADDQRDFDRYYSEWVEDTRANDRDRVAKDAGYLQAIMARNAIPADVPFDHIDGCRGLRRIPGTQMAPDLGREGSPLTTSVSSTKNTQIGWKTRAATIATKLTRTRAACRTSWRGNNIPANVPYDRIASPDAGRYH